MARPREIRFQATERAGDVAAILLEPKRPRLGYVFAHGAGAGMRHPFMQRVAEDLAALDIATLRFNFPYAEAGRRRPDHARTLLETVRRAVTVAREALPAMPLLAGGKSMGGRMTSQAMAQQSLEGVVGLAFLGFPLHPPKKAGTARADHLADVRVPMLFLQGDRDALARLDLLEAVLAEASDRATLHLVRGADHGFAVLKRSGRDADDVHRELSATFDSWARALVRE